MRPSTITQTRPKAVTSRENHAQWATVVWNDPVNTQDYVASVFARHFGYSTARSRALMLKVHNEGRATVSTGLRERMEADVYAMHSYGLKATIELADDAT